MPTAVAIRQGLELAHDYDLPCYAPLLACCYLARHFGRSADPRPQRDAVVDYAVCLRLAIKYLTDENCVPSTRDIVADLSHYGIPITGEEFNAQEYGMLETTLQWNLERDAVEVRRPV